MTTCQPDQAVPVSDPPVCRDRLLNLTKQRRQLRIACNPRVRETGAMLARAVDHEFLRIDRPFEEGGEHVPAGLLGHCR